MAGVRFQPRGDLGEGIHKLAREEIGLKKEFI